MSEQMGKVLEFKKRQQKPKTTVTDAMDYNTRMESIRKSLERINQLVADIRKDERFGYIRVDPSKEPPK